MATGGANTVWRLSRVGVVLLATVFLIDGFLPAEQGFRAAYEILGYELTQTQALLARHFLSLPVVLVIIASNWITMSALARKVHATLAVLLAGGSYFAGLNVLEGNSLVAPGSAWTQTSMAMILTYLQIAWLTRAGALPWLRRADDPGAVPFGDKPGFQELIGEQDEGRLLRIATLLHTESDRMRKLSMQTLIIVGVLVGLASLVVLFAGYITSIDLRGASPVQKAQSYLATAQSARNAAQQALNDRRNLLRSRIDFNDQEKALEAQLEALEAQDQALDPTRPEKAQGIGQVESQLARLRQQFNGLPAERRRTVDEFNDEITELTKVLDSRRIIVATNRRLVERAQEMDVLNTQIVGDGDNGTIEKPANASNTTEALIAAAVTRFGIVILIIFLAQALINLYRYSLRLSAFYKARAVMLILANGDLSIMEQAGKSLSPDHLSLGREPSSPLAEVQKIAEVAKSLR